MLFALQAVIVLIESSCFSIIHPYKRNKIMLKKTVATIGIAALAGAGAMSVLPEAKAQPAAKGGLVQIAACNPCNPCAGKNPCNPCNPCAGKNPCAPCNPWNPCAGK